MECLSLSEKQLLYRKYRANHFTHEEASEKVKDFNNYLKEISKKLKFQKKTEEKIKQEIQLRFEHEFKRLYSE